MEWLGSTKKTNSEEEEKGETTNGWFLASKELEGESHMGPQWFEASVEDLGQLEIFDLPPALNVHVEVTAGELACAYISIRICIFVCICICIFICIGHSWTTGYL